MSYDSETECRRCGINFTIEEWLNRHTDHDGEDIHAYCCETEGPCSGTVNHDDSFDHLVSKGIELLDEARPDWRQLVDLDGLDLSSCHRCVLGQVFGSYTAGLSALGIDAPTDCEVGFEVPYHIEDGDETVAAYEGLQAAWERAVRS